MKPNRRELRAIVLAAATVVTLGWAAGCKDRPPSACAAGVPRMQVGPDGEVPTGMKYCEGFEHRAEALECVLPPETKGDCDVPEGTCQSDADCTAGPRGLCNVKGRIRFGPSEPIRCECEYPCATDADCAPDQACLCPGVPGSNPQSLPTCVKAFCRTDADCEGEYACAFDGAFACHTPRDKCRTRSDCPEGCYECNYKWKQDRHECVDLKNACDR